MHDTNSSGSPSDVEGTVASILGQLTAVDEDSCDSDGYVPSESERSGHGADAQSATIENLLGSILKPSGTKPFTVVKVAPKVPPRAPVTVMRAVPPKISVAAVKAVQSKVAPKVPPKVPVKPLPNFLALGNIGGPVIKGPINVSNLVGIVGKPVTPVKPIIHPTVLSPPAHEEPPKAPEHGGFPFPGGFSEIHGHAKRFAHERPVLFLLALGAALYFIFFKQDSLFETVLHTGTKTRKHDKVETFTEEVHTKREAVVGKPVFPGKKTAD